MIYPKYNIKTMDFFIKACLFASLFTLPDQKYVATRHCMKFFSGQNI